MCPLKLRYVVLVVAFALRGIEAITYQCDHYENGQYNLRYCALFDLVVTHDAEDVDFLSEYPRPYRFELYHSNLTEIPRSLFSTFPEMQTIDLSATGIENINKFTFEQAKQLQTLKLRQNRLTTLVNFVFKGCDRLVWLDLAHNQLGELKEKTFNDIPSVTTLDLSHNQLVTLPETLFASLEKLSQLKLSNNRLVGLSDATFQHNPLMLLDLNYNRLGRLNASVLANLNQLQRVFLAGNALQVVTLPATPRDINLAENNLTTLTMGEAASYAVTTLNLSRNAFTSISNVSLLSNLKSLDVSFNALNALALTTFLSLKDLTYLNLEATNLSTLEHGIFSQQASLQWLDLSFNRLRTFDLTVLTSATKLERLHLDGNTLTALEYRWIPELFPSLTYLGLFANHWNCSYLISMIRFCKQHSISLEPAKEYGTVLHMTNVQGIYCLGSASSHRNGFPVVGPVHHSLGNSTVESPKNPTTTTTTTDQLLQLIRQVNETTFARVLELENERRGGRVASVASATPPAADTSCSAMHAYNYQIFILLILSVILIINIGFLLWVQHNANARRAVDQMIIFRREHGASVQTELHGDF